MSTRHLRMFTSHRLEVLADALARRLAEAPLGPLERETIVVPSRGMARWVNVYLARAQGIAASVEFPFPFTWARRVIEALELAPPVDPDEHESDPFGAAALQWRLHDLLGRLEALDAPPPDLAPLRSYLEDDPDLRKRGQLAARLASTFAGYQLQRPAQLVAWEQARWFARAPDLAAGEPWQAALWRALVRETPSPPLSRALLDAIEGLRGGSLDASRIGARVEVFGVTTLPPVLLALLDALGPHLDTALSFVSPTRGYWGDLRARPITITPAGLPPLALELDAEEDAHEILGHPLLASWGRLGRDFHRAVVGIDESGALTEIEADDPPRSTLLGALQADVLDFVDPATRAPLEQPVVDPHDHSLRVHLCHSPLREMEVLRDAILRAFEDLPDLRPSEVLVLVPDLERYAPFARAVLGRTLDLPEGSRSREARLPVRIADGRSGTAGSYARLLLELLRLPDARLTATEVLDLFEIDPFARRFGLSSEDLPELRELVRGAGVRWGVDPRQRAEQLELPPYEGASWQEGLDRLLLGFALGETETMIDGLLPVADATTGRVALVARLTRAFEALTRAVGALRGPRPLGQWGRELRRVLLEISVAESERETEERRALVTILEGWEDLAPRFELGLDVGRRTVRDALESILEDDAAGRGFVSGSITVAELRPMRSLPYRVIALAGLGDEFPRRDAPAGFDLVARAPRAGDRTARLDDRQLFLEILLSARDRLVLTLVGRSIRDNSELARSVCVDELLEVLDRTFAPHRDRRASETVMVRHPLQPFDARYADGTDASLFTYDRAHAAAAQAGHATRARILAGSTSEGRRFLEGEVMRGPRAGTDRFEVDLATLSRFYRDPSSWFVREVLRMRLRRDATELDTEAFAIARFDAWRLRDHELARITDGQPVEPASAVVQRLGLARGRFGEALADHQREQLRFVLADAGVDLQGSELRAVELEGEDFVLRGSLLVDPRRGRIALSPSALDARLRAGVWVEHLALGCTVAGDPPRTTRLLSLKDGASETWNEVPDAPARLAALVHGFRDAHACPLPFYPLTSEAWWKQWKLATDDDTRRSVFLREQVRTAWDEASRFNSEPEALREAVKLCVRGLTPDEIASEEFAHWAQTIFGAIDEVRAEGKAS